LGRIARSSGRGRVSGGGNFVRIIPVSIVAIRQSGCNIGRHNRTHLGRHWVAAAREHLPRGSVGIGSRARDATGEAGTVADTIASTFGHTWHVLLPTAGCWSVGLSSGKEASRSIQPDFAGKIGDSLQVGAAAHE